MAIIDFKTRIKVFHGKCNTNGYCYSGNVSCKYLEFRRGMLFGYDSNNNYKYYGFFCTFNGDKKLGDCQADCKRCGNFVLVNGPYKDRDIGHID